MCTGHSAHAEVRLLSPSFIGSQGWYSDQIFGLISWAISQPWTQFWNYLYLEKQRQPLLKSVYMCFVILGFLLFEAGFHVAPISLDETWCTDQAGPEAHEVPPLFTKCYHAEISTHPRAPFPPRAYILPNGILFLPLEYTWRKSAIRLAYNAQGTFSYPHKAKGIFYRGQWVGSQHSERWHFPLVWSLDISGTESVSHAVWSPLLFLRPSLLTQVKTVQHLPSGNRVPASP